MPVAEKTEHRDADEKIVEIPLCWGRQGSPYSS